MDKIEKYIDELLEKSTPDRPIWNIEKILQVKKSTWNYIDGCMIKAILEMYAITKDENIFHLRIILLTARSWRMVRSKDIRWKN